MPRDADEFDGIEISSPLGDLRIGRGGVRVSAGLPDDDFEVARIRRRVRRKLQFYRNVAFFVVIVGALALIDWGTDGGWWVQWVAAIWGGILGLQFLTAFVAPMLWGRDVEERMVQRELERRGYTKPSSQAD